MDVVVEIPEKTEEQSAMISVSVEDVFDQLGIEFDSAIHSADLSKVTYTDVRLPARKRGKSGAV